MDSDGEFWNIAAGAVIGASISVVSQVVGNFLSGGDLGKGVIVAAVSGAASGALSATGLGKWGQAFANAGVALVGEMLNQGRDGIKTKEGQVAIAKATVAGFVSGRIGGNGMRNQNGDYYKAAQHAKTKVQSVLSKKYSNPATSTKIINRAAKTVRAVGYKESKSTGIKFGIGSMLSQLITRFRWKK